MKRLAAFALLLHAALLQAPLLQGQDKRAVFTQIDEHLAALRDITGLRTTKKIPYDLISRDKVNEFLKKRIAEVAKPEELRAEELVLKRFGLVPRDFDLVKTTVDLLTEQAAAFYDYDKRRLFISDWTPPDTLEAALVHELAHALADQNFNLGRFMKKASKSDDGALALMAVIEGQASWLMSECLARRMGQSLLDSPTTLALMQRMNEPGGAAYPVFDAAPLYIRETLVFPYTRGMSFQHAIREKLGPAAFAEVFRRPPVSTQQILHPEKYLERALPIELPEPASPGRGFKRLIGGTVGELDHEILLRQYSGMDAAKKLAPQWRGGVYSLFENTRETRIVLSYASEWASEEDAREFLRLYEQVLKGKWKSLTVSRRTETSLAGEGDDGPFEVQVLGKRVTAREGR